MEYIEERLKELEQEKDELKEFEKLDKERRGLQYTIYDQELSDTNNKLKDVIFFLFFLLILILLLF